MAKCVSIICLGVDFTASNEYQGENTFGGKSLHSMSAGTLNPYQQVNIRSFYIDHCFVELFGFATLLF